VKAVERRVLHALGCHRRGELLEALHESPHARERQHLGVQAWPLPRRLGHGAVDQLLVLLGCRAHDVGAIDRQQRRDARERIALAAQRVRLEVALAGAVATPQPIEAGLRGRIHQHAVHLVGQPIAGGAVQRPAWQGLAVGLDLLAHHVQRQHASAGRSGTDPTRVGRLQPLEIPRRIAQAVGVVDAQAIDAAGRGQIQHEPVRGLEHLGLLHAQRGQFVDVEEAPVVDRGRLAAQRARAFTQHRGGRCAPPGGGRLSGRQHGMGIGQRGQRLASHARAKRRGTRKHRRQRGRVEREAMIEVAQREAAVVVQRDVQLAVRERSGQSPAERRQHQAPARPVDVEPAGVRRTLAMREHVHPPRVVGADAHVVGHDVQKQSKSVRVQRIAEALELGHAAQLGVDLRAVGDVVAMRAAGPRAQQRRGVDVTHAQALQVRQDRARRVEVEARVELQPVGGAGDAREHGGLHARAPPSTASTLTRTPRAPMAASVARSACTSSPTSGSATASSRRFSARCHSAPSPSTQCTCSRPASSS
jgi:hypothetical protein